MGRSSSGWMCGPTFYEYIANVFNPWLLKKQIQKPILLFLDGHRSHLTLHLSNFCAANGIEIIALYPNSTHILQPMDLSVFRPLKSYWKKAVNIWKLENSGQNLKKEHFAPVLKTALQSLSKESIKHGFRAGGLQPFGPDYVDFTKIKSSRKSISDKTARMHFLRCLEQEIIAKFGSEKLQLFKDLFNKNRDEVEARLPDEDSSLFVIWANNKQTVYNSSLDNEESTPNIHVIEESPAVIEAPLSVTHCENYSSANKNEASTSTASVIQASPAVTENSSVKFCGDSVGRETSASTSGLLVEESVEVIDASLSETHRTHDSLYSLTAAPVIQVIPEVIDNQSVVTPVDTNEPTNVSPEIENRTKETESFPTVTDPGKTSTGKK